MGNIADSPHGIAAHFATGARTQGRRRTAQIHLREVEDGYWTRLRLYTEHSPNGQFTTYLSFDHHKERRDGGESVRIKIATTTSTVIGREDCPGRYSEKRLIAAYDRAAAVLLADPAPIDALLRANDPEYQKGPTP